MMAIISELYFAEIDTEWDYEGVLNKAIDKGRRLAAAGCKFADFGTRRRRSYKTQRIIIDGLRQGSNDSLIGTSNVKLALDNNIKPIGTMAHEWLMGISVLEGLYNANYFALQNWVRVYHANLGIALTDTYGLPSFIRNFSLELAKLYDGVRHDSGCPFKFANNIIKMYKGYGIDPTSKSIVFSDGLDVETAVKLQQEFGHKVRVGFGIGTHLTNDFENSPALNIVIKLWSCGKDKTEKEIPVVKLSDTPGKVMGDPDAVRVAQWIHQGKAL